MSGRALRRLPVLALARYIGIGFTASSYTRDKTIETKGVQSGGSTATERCDSNMELRGGGADIKVWLDGMEQVILQSDGEIGRLL